MPRATRREIGRLVAGAQPGRGLVVEARSSSHLWTDDKLLSDRPRAMDRQSVDRRDRDTPATVQLPARARSTTRLKTAVLNAVIDSGRAVAEVAHHFGVAWCTVQAGVKAAAVLLPSVDDLQVIDPRKWKRKAPTRCSGFIWSAPI